MHQHYAVHSLPYSHISRYLPFISSYSAYSSLSALACLLKVLGVAQPPAPQHPVLVTAISTNKPPNTAIIQSPVVTDCHTTASPITRRSTRKKCHPVNIFLIPICLLMNPTARHCMPQYLLLLMLIVPCRFLHRCGKR